MALPPPSEREEIHTRRYEFKGYRRADGLWDIEGRIVDSKSYGFENKHRGHVEAGEPVHDMQLRLTVDSDFSVRDCEAVTHAGPFAICPAVTPNFKRMIGAKIGPGWRKEIKKRVGGPDGCTHINEMLGAMATAAYQTIVPLLAREGKRPGTPGKRPPLIDTCHAFAADGEVVRRTWPQWYEGDLPVPEKGEPL